MNKKIALLYGPMGGNTENIAKLVASKLGNENCELISVGIANEDTLANYDKIIIGGATIGTHNWAHKTTNTDWDNFLPILRKLDLTNKTFAIFGLGDQVAYANHFVDDMRVVYDIVIESKGKIIGQCPIEGYDFNESEAVIDNKFVGLPIDEDFQKDLTEERLNNWVTLIREDWK